MEMINNNLKNKTPEAIQQASEAILDDVRLPHHDA